MTQVSGEWLERTGTQKVCRVLVDAGYQALFVGGCVRNALLEALVNDIDIATDAHPQAVVDLARAAGLHAIPTGIEHGTVTVVSDSIAHEITTFRKDVETDGRHAVVAFSKSVEDDARRRDFTMNALYADCTGQVIDPIGGMVDLRARKVRFIDDADLRIREDYLRILRYFRFHAWYGDADKGIDPEALAAIGSNIDGLAQLSKERIGTEVLKLLAATDPAMSVASMWRCGALGAVLVGADNRGLGPLVHLEQMHNTPVDPIRRLAVLGGLDVTNALRLSNKHARKLAILKREIGGTDRPSVLGYRYGVDQGMSILLLRSALLEMPMPEDVMWRLQTGDRASCPVTAKDLMPTYKGAAIGAALRKLEDEWIKSDYTLNQEELLRLL